MHQAQTPDPAGRQSTDRRWLALTVLLLAASLTLVSVTSVNVALPAIRTDLGAGPAGQALMLTGYAIAFALILLPAGRWGDRYGHTTVFIAGTVTFALASAWCGLATDTVQIVLARVLAGFAAGLTITPVNALIQLLYHGLERARPFGIMGAVFGAASAAGPLLGGILVQSGGDWGWRLVFLINVPFGIAAVLMSIFLLPRTRARGAPGSDPLGILLFTVGIAATMLPFSLGEAPRAGSALAFVGGLVALALFVLWERRRTRLGAFAVVPLRHFRQRALPIGIAMTFLGFAGFTAAFLFLALLWQDALGRSALGAGLLVMPFALGSMTSAAYTDRLTRRFGLTIITVGQTMITAGLVAVGLLILLVPPDAQSFWIMLLPLLCTGMGVGLFIGPTTNAAFAQTAERDAGVASALITVAQRCGSALGIGLISMLYATLPGGTASLTVQATAAFVTAGFAAASGLVMILSRRSRMPLG